MVQCFRIVLTTVFLATLVSCGGGGGSAPPGESPAPLTLTFTEVTSGLATPTAITHAGDASGRLFLVEQDGRVLILAGGTLLPVPFLDISSLVASGGEQGLLSLVFPPDSGSKDHFYVYYTRTGDGAGVLSRFTIGADPDLADPSSEEILLTVAQPFANHNGGQLAFGPVDGFLYLGLGDGGSGGDPLNSGQDPSTLLGSLLRLDVEGATSGYAIPADNPFVGDPNGADEVWAYGLRNPWRFSFDRLTGDLYLGDVGQADWEEIDLRLATQPAGANFGWNILEGNACYPPASLCTPPANYAAPVVSYDHGLGSSVTGGYVYRGPGNPDMQGLYFYGDFGSGCIWALFMDSSGMASRLIVDTAFNISTFGEDEAGRLYLADYATGTIYRIDQQ